MAFCSNCGTQAAGPFCPNCGTKLAGDSSVPPPSGSSYSSSTSATAGLSANVVAALCYIFGIIGGVIFLLIDPYKSDRTVRFHAFQSIYLTLGVIIVGFALAILGILSHGILLLLVPLYNIFLLVLWIYMIVTAYQGKRVMLPIIGEQAAKQA